ncbi:hypothetical protein NC651_035601 [Populus alba x Populus x berolinensis]|nr:hypothetical protein NC651_035601 [Populus alba x Populus x berolinensis]
MINLQSDEEEDHAENSLGVEAALSMLRFYKREISPLLPNSCRYVPTCSEYSMEAYKKYGVVKGTVLTAWRLCRCNPLGNVGLASILRDGLMRILLFKKNDETREPILMFSSASSSVKEGMAEDSVDTENRISLKVKDALFRFALMFALRILIVYINFGCHSLLGYVRAAASDKEFIYDHD